MKLVDPLGLKVKVLTPLGPATVEKPMNINSMIIFVIASKISIDVWYI